MSSKDEATPNRVPGPAFRLGGLSRFFLCLILFGVGIFAGFLLHPTMWRKKVYEKLEGEKGFAVYFDFSGTLTVQSRPPVWSLTFRDYIGSREFIDLISTSSDTYELRCRDGTKLEFVRPKITR